MKQLYPEIEPFDSGMLEVSDIHTIYYERCGNPDGIPVLFLHGGPGGGLLPMYRQFFDPAAYHVLLFDQRGSGKSTPHADLRENTTWDLVKDIETLREKFEIDKWFVFGGSWGSTLSLTYAETHPERVSGLVLRGIFLTRPKELKWFYQYGASEIYPDFWERYRDEIPEDERGNMMSAYHKRLTSDDKQTRVSAARAWSVWEGSTSKLYPDKDLMNHWEDENEALSLARIECHYFMNNSFFPTENYLIENVDKIRHIPTVIVQGRYDVVCPIVSAWELKKAFPEADLRVVDDAGHSISEKGITSELVDAMDGFRDGGKEVAPTRQLTIKGWETGFNKLKMNEILVKKLMLDKEQSEQMSNAVSAGQAITLDIEDEKLAHSLYNDLIGVGAIVDFE